jgi:hypothetical protein
MDQTELLGDRLQQVHPRPQDVRLAIPRLAHHDPHGLLRLAHCGAGPRGRHANPAADDARPLRRVRDPHRRVVRSLSLSLVLSNSVYIYLSVSFIQMLQALMPVAVYSLAVALRTDSFRRTSMLNMLGGHHRRDVRRGAVRRVRRRALARRHRAHPDPAHLQGHVAQPC